MLVALLVATLAPGGAAAGTDVTRDSLDRLDEVFTARVEDEDLHPKDLTPAIIVSLAPAWAETETWYPTAALKVLSRQFGAAGLRLCTACMLPRTDVQPGRLEQNTGAPTLDEIGRLDALLRGTAPRAKSAIWLDETPEGVSLRVVDLGTGRIVLAENVDPRMKRRAQTEKNFALARELDRRARGDGLTQVFVDAVLYPGQHISLDWTDQWGDTNCNLSGVTISIVDPFLGVGGVYYRVIPEAWNLMVGGQVLVSLPLAVINSISSSTQALFGDNVVTAVGMVRVPIGRSNYGVVASLSTNGRVGIGISLMNVSLLPVLP